MQSYIAHTGILMAVPRARRHKLETGVYHIDIGSSGDERFIGWGWHWPELLVRISHGVGQVSIHKPNSMWTYQPVLIRYL